MITIISLENGFVEMSTSSISSKVFEKAGCIHKISQRNSFERVHSDLATLEDMLVGFEDRIPATRIFSCMHEGQMYTCVQQNKIDGKEIAKHSRKEALAIFKESGNLLFMKRLLEHFFSSIASRTLYPDLVGNPDDPHLLNSVNLMVTRTGKLMLCDVGLSPHEDTLAKHGGSFFESKNVTRYVRRINESKVELGI